MTPAADLAASLLARLPPHAAGLTIERNPGRTSYETVALWLSGVGAGSEPDWPDADARQRAIDTDDVWVMQWYPETPVGFRCVAAPTLAELLELAGR